MMKHLRLPDAVRSRTEYKRKYGVKDMYHAFTRLPGAAAKMVRNKRKKLIDRDFVERLQLAVTEVNGCAACSYAHAYMALKQGMSHEEISSFLSGDGNFVKKEEALAIVFAQHFADARGYPDRDAYKSIVDEYGRERAEVILSAAQIMIAGNIYGIPFSAFHSRMKGKPYKDSTLVYELGMQAVGLLLLPVALIQGIAVSLAGFPGI